MSDVWLLTPLRLWLLRQSEVDRWNNYLESSANGKQNKKAEKENPPPNLAAEGKEFIGLNYSYCLPASIAFSRWLLSAPISVSTYRNDIFLDIGTVGSPLWKQESCVGKACLRSKFLSGDSSQLISFHNKHKARCQRGQKRVSVCNKKYHLRIK